jgi:uncharacterized protein YbjT (DUF2867 family)
VDCFVLTSSVGAKSTSASFYLRVKGELEEAIANVGFGSLTFIRPSGLGGDRAESRPLERFGLGVAQMFSPVIPPRYRVVDASFVAQALVDAAVTRTPGLHVIESEAITRPPAADEQAEAPR